MDSSAGAGRAPGSQIERATHFLYPRPGGLAERFAGRVSGRHPALVFAVALLLGFALGAALAFLLGLLVTDVLIKTGGIGATDNDFVESLVDDRTSFLTTVSDVGSIVGSYALVGIAVILAIVFALRRQWVLAAYFAFLPAVESGLYRLTSMLDPRLRPTVPRLDQLDVNASFPSGHTAASVAVYGGLALLASSFIVSPPRRLVMWLAVAVVVALVAMSRMYRGMHHPLDVLGGIVVGIMAIAIVLFACRAASAGARLRELAYEGART